MLLNTAELKLVLKLLNEAPADLRNNTTYKVLLLRIQKELGK